MVIWVKITKSGKLVICDRKMFHGSGKSEWRCIGHPEFVMNASSAADNINSIGALAKCLGLKPEVAYKMELRHFPKG